MNTSKITSVGIRKRKKTWLLRYQKPVVCEPELAIFPRLKELYITDGHFSTMPSGLSVLWQLRRIEILNTPLRLWPSDFCGLMQLETLTFRNTQLGQIPPEVRTFGQLKFFICANSGVSSLPLFLFKLPLQQLVLTNNHLRELPAEVAQLSKSLMSLCLSSNKLTQLPPDLAKLQELQAINISHNPLETLPIFLFSMPKLAVIYAEGVAVFHANFRNNALHEKFYKAQNKLNPPLSIRYELYRLFSGDVAACNDVSLKALLYGVGFAEVNVSTTAYTVLQTKAVPLQKNSKILIIGTPPKDRTTLKIQLKYVDIGVETKFSQAVTHFIIGKNIKPLEIELLLNSGLPFLFPPQVEQFLEENEALFLVPEIETEESKESVAKIKALMQTYDEVNIFLALQMMKQNGVPSSLKTQLFFTAKNKSFSPSICLKARKLLELKASLPLLLKMKNTRLITSGFDLSAWQFYMEGTELDWEDIVHFVVHKNYKKELHEHFFYLIPKAKAAHYFERLAAIPNRELSLTDLPKSLQSMALRLNIFKNISIFNLKGLPNELVLATNVETLSLIDIRLLLDAELEKLRFLRKLTKLCMKYCSFYKFPMPLCTMQQIKEIHWENAFMKEGEHFNYFDQARYEQEKIFYRL